MSSEQLVSVVRERVIETLGSRVAGECLMALADKGWFSHRQLPEVAKQVAARYGVGHGGDLSQITDIAIERFARAAGLQPLEGGST